MEQRDRSLRRRLVRLVNLALAWGTAALSALGLVGLFFSHFVPSPRTVAAAEVLSVVVALLYGAFALGIGDFGWNVRSPQVIAAVKSSPWLGRASLRVPFFALLFTCFAWVAFSAGLPWAVNALIGEEGSAIVVVNGWGTLGRHHACYGPTIQGVPPFMIGVRAFCLRNEQRFQFPVGARVKLTGHASVLGISPKGYARLQN